MLSEYSSQRSFSSAFLEEPFFSLVLPEAIQPEQAKQPELSEPIMKPRYTVLAATPALPLPPVQPHTPCAQHRGPVRLLAPFCRGECPHY